jgi:hypothetical protein
MVVFLPRIERGEEAVLVADIIERHDVITAKAGIPLPSTVPLVQGDPRLRGDDGYEVRGTRYEVASPIADNIANIQPRTPHLETSHRERSEPISQPEPYTEPFAIAMLQPITDITKQIPHFGHFDRLSDRSVLAVVEALETTATHIETTTSHPATPHLAPESILQERLELAINDFVITPARTVIHNVARRFFERRTEVELFLEEQEFQRFFARHRDGNMQEL